FMVGINYLDIMFNIYFWNIAFIYKDLKFQMVSILLWVVLFIISLDFKSGYFDLLSLFMIFIPVLLLNIFSYFNQRKIKKSY
ncbi:MAG: hypothetical protein PHF21_04130, partial [Bacilli bacterium]|nr:hypothetical protein [Bacilli bacterium]